MSTRKFRKSRPRKTVRRRRVSTAGKILPPLDVRSSKHLKEFEKRIKQGDLTIILVWAPWCPHCHTMMPHFDAAAKSPNRSIQAIKVQDTMLPAVNQTLTGSINKSAKPLNVEGYPSIIVVDKQGNKVTDIEPVRDTKTMTSLMENAGPLAKEAGLNTPGNNQAQVANAVKNSLKPNANIGNANKNKGANGLLKNMGFEEEGLVSGMPSNMNINSPRNIDVGEEELKGSIASVNTSNKPIKLNSIPANKLNNAGKNSKKATPEAPEEAIAPSPLNTFNAPKNEARALPADMKKLSQEAEEVTSLASPLTPPNAVEDIDNSEKVESISNKLTPEQKISGGGRAKGGSMYSVLARTTYTLAPAAALLATAAMVMKGKKRSSRKTRKHSKKSRKTHRRRR